MSEKEIQELLRTVQELTVSVKEFTAANQNLTSEYRRMAKAMKTSHVANNEIQRQFRKYAPRKALLTDITFLHYSGGVSYLSPIIRRL